MKILYAVFIYSVLVKECYARGSHGGHGGHSSHSSHSSHGSHGTHGLHGGYHHVTSSHSHYSYHPPKAIHYTCRHCSSSTTYPVYGHQLPNYVYVYKDSGGKYNQLLTGLAMYNLGRSMEETHSTQHSGGGSYYHKQRYPAEQEEKCSLQVIEDHRFGETEFPCFMISSFIESSSTNKSNTIDITSSQIVVKPNITKEEPLKVTENQECVLWRNLSTHNEKNEVPCALLNEYANTVKPSVAQVYIWLPLAGTALMLYLFYDCICEKKKDEVKEAVPLNVGDIATYRTNLSGQ